MLKCFLLQLALSAFIVVARAAREQERGAFSPFSPRSDEDNGCDVRHALRLLKDLSAAGDSFCTSLLHIPQGGTKTVSDVVTSTEVCSARTETTTAHGTFTTIVYGLTTTLPQLTFTSYSSTVLIPSGASRSIQKRASPATPTALTTCPSPTITKACSSLLQPTTTTITSTFVHSEHKCLSTTTTTFTTTRHTVTSTIPFIVTPPPVSVPGTGILTTTVPAECVSKPSDPNSNTLPDSDEIRFSMYPDQPGTLVECCVSCHHTLNCVAASFDTDSDECSYLIRTNGSSGTDVSAICPLGLQIYGFSDTGGDGDILPGPCAL